MPGSTGFPLFRFVVDGTDHDMEENRVRITNWTPFLKDGQPQLGWVVNDLPAAALPDPYLGKSIELYADEGTEALIFAGDCVVSGPWSVQPDGRWARGYTALGLEYRGNHIPIINPADMGSSIRFNQEFGTSGYRASLAGRSIGEMVRYVLEAKEAADALKLAGIGDYTQVPTSPATAHATVAAGEVTVVIDTGGSGYGTGTAPRCILVGGDGTYTSATVTLSAGAVASVAVTGSADYTVAPEVWISPLPVVTLNDLAGMTFEPPYPVYVAGDRILQTLRGVIRQQQPNHEMVVLPDGTIRVWDLRVNTNSTLTLGSATAPVVWTQGVQLVRDVQGSYSRVIVRGGPNVRIGWLSTLEETLEEYFDHDGLTVEADIKESWKYRDFIDPINSGIATFSCTIDAGEVDAITVTNPGWGYPAGTDDLTFSGGGGTGATGTYTAGSNGRISSVTLTDGGGSYTSAPVVVGKAPGKGAMSVGSCDCPSATEVTVDPSDDLRAWAADYWDQTATGTKGVIMLVDSTGDGIDLVFSAKVISNASLTAGGTSTLTVDRTLPVTTFDSYSLVGTQGDGSIVWRRYRPVDTDLRAVLLDYFPFAVPLIQSSTDAATMTSFPVCQVEKNGSTAVVPITVDTDQGWFITDKPTCTFFGPQLEPDDTTVADNEPDDVRILAALVNGTLEAIKPANVDGDPDYAGTCHTVEGLERTLIVNIPSWIDTGRQADMEAWAQDLLDSVKDSVVEGSIPLIGWASTYHTYGKAVKLVGDGFDTLWDDEYLPVVGCDVQFLERPMQYRTTLRVSNRRESYSAAAFDRPLPTGDVVLGGAGFGGGIMMGTPMWGGFAGGIGAAPTSNTAYMNMGNPWMQMASAGRQNWLNNAATGRQGWLDWSRPHAMNTNVRDNTPQSFLNAQMRAARGATGPEATWRATASAGDKAIDDLLAGY